MMTHPTFCPGCGRNMERGEPHTADCDLCTVCHHECPQGVDEFLGECPCCEAGTAPADAECCCA